MVFHRRKNEFHIRIPIIRNHIFLININGISLFEKKKIHTDNNLLISFGILKMKNFKIKVNCKLNKNGRVNA